MADRPSHFTTALVMLDLMYHGAVRQIRKSHGNAVIALLLNIMQTVILVAVFYAMFVLIGSFGSSIRGDPLLYVMTGIFLFMCHVKAVGSVMQAEGQTSQMIKHAPMNAIVGIGAAALGELYVQLLSMVVVLFLYHAIWTPLEVHDLFGSLSMLLLAWFSGVAVGMIFMAAKPWAPSFTGLMSQIYSRAQMVASGKMFVANTLPSAFLPYFDWNPLFHIIDQARGFAFLNYTPYHTNVVFPLVVTAGTLVVGMMAEFYTRQRASASWSAKQ